MIVQASVPNILVSNIPFRMGWVGQGVNGHACSLRSVRLSNVALYTSAFTPEWDYTLHPSTTIAWWKLNEGNGTTVSDSVNNHNGTLVGSPLPGWE